IIVKAATNSDDSDDYERCLVLQNCGIENEELSQEPCRERHAGQRDHPNQHCKSKEGRSLRQTIKICNLFAGLLGHDYQNCEAKECHEQIGNEIKAHGCSIETCHTDQQISGVCDARIGKESLQVCLRQSRKISIDQSQQRDHYNQSLRLRQCKEWLQDPKQHDESGSLGPDGK